MKHIISLLILFTISCKSQTVSLETMAQCMQENPPYPCPDNFNYVKDINNTLNKYVGTWKGTFDGITYEINLIKKENVYVDGVVRDDKLIGRLKIKDSNNITLYNSFTEIDDSKTNFSGRSLTSNLQHYMMYFSGDSPTGCINYGTVYLTIKSATPTTLNIFYMGDYDIVEGECPSTFKRTFPEKQNIYLTKQ